MSKFYNEHKAKEEVRVKNSLRREKLATYFFDLSKLSFGGSAFAAVFAWISDVGNYWYLVVLVVGLAVTVIFAVFANRLLKK
jgi:hypothetical protein